MGLHILIISLIIIFVCIWLRSRYEIRHFKVTGYTIHTEKLVDSYKFIFISDLHNCCYGNDNSKLVEGILNEKPDFLLIGGDLIVGKRNIGNSNPDDYYANATAFLKQISGKLPVYYTFGNHETRVKNRSKINPIFNAYMESIKDCQIEYLLNRTAFFEKDKEIIGISGIELPEKAYDDKNFQVNYSVMNNAAFNILMVHTPDFADKYDKSGADLILCGHNHGGTVRIPLLGGVISREYKPFPKYDYGLFKMKNSNMFVTGGLGDHTVHFRLNNLPEIVVINLHGKYKEKSI